MAVPCVFSLPGDILTQAMFLFCILIFWNHKGPLLSSLDGFEENPTEVIAAVIAILVKVR